MEETEIFVCECNSFEHQVKFMYGTEDRELFIYLHLTGDTFWSRLKRLTSPATPFPLKDVSGTRVVFENPAHDFPQRIIYWKDGADLRARIEGTQNGKEGSMEWRWSPATPKV